VPRCSGSTARVDRTVNASDAPSVAAGADAGTGAESAAVVVVGAAVVVVLDDVEVVGMALVVDEGRVLAVVVTMTVVVVVVQAAWSDELCDADHEAAHTAPAAAA